MRFARIRSLALAIMTLALVAPVLPAAAQNNSITYNYRDADGSGRLTVTDLGADSATGGRQIGVQLVQNGVTYRGSGIEYPLQTTMPVRTLLAFTLVSPNGRSYFFQGTTLSGITVSGQGTYHRVGFPGQKFEWNIVLGG